MNIKNLPILFVVIILAISCNNLDTSPPPPDKIVVFYDDFNDSTNWEINPYWDSLNNISIVNGFMIGSVVSTEPAMLGSSATTILDDTYYIDSTITKFGIKIKLNEGDIHYRWFWPPYGNNGILFNLSYGYHAIRIPNNYGESVDVSLPLGEEFIVEYDEGEITFTVDGIEYDEEQITCFRNTNGHSSPPKLQVIMEGYFISDPNYQHRVEIDFIEFYIYK